MLLSKENMGIYTHTACVHKYRIEGDFLQTTAKIVEVLIFRWYYPAEC